MFVFKRENPSNTAILVVLFLRRHKYINNNNLVLVWFQELHFGHWEPIEPHDLDFFKIKALPLNFQIMHSIYIIISIDNQSISKE